MHGNPRPQAAQTHGYFHPAFGGRAENSGRYAACRKPFRTHARIYLLVLYFRARVDIGIRLDDGTNAKAFTLLWSGDLPAIAKIMGFAGHSGYQGCRFCWHRGVYATKPGAEKGHICYPHSSEEILRPKLRTHSECLATANELDQASTKEKLSRIRKRTGKHHSANFAS